VNIDLEGRFDVSAGRQVVFGYITDPHRFGPLLPYFREIKEVGPEFFRLGLEVGVPQIRGTADVHVNVVELVPDQLARYRSTTKMALGVVDSDLSFRLEDAGAGTAVVWQTRSKVRGNLASIAGGILAPLARRNINAVIESLQAALGAMPNADPAQADAAAAPKAPASLWQRMLTWLGLR
jgi:carbon monoxide dehydrogenase subunit G